MHHRSLLTPARAGAETTSWIELLQKGREAFRCQSHWLTRQLSRWRPSVTTPLRVRRWPSGSPWHCARERAYARLGVGGGEARELPGGVAERDALETALRHGSSSYRGLPFLHSLRLCLAHGRTAARAACEDAGWAVWWARESAKKALGRLRYRAALLRLRTALAAGRWIARLRTPPAVGLPSAEPPEPPESAVAAAALAAPGAALVGVVVPTGTSAGGASAGGASAGANADAGAGYTAWAGEWARAHSDASAAVAGPAVAASPAVAQRRVVVLPKYSL
ncbi:hypothetical protein EMIHUDRAFT_233165 [Emiliania huxleyi CCMP1516]|uniref:Uncharacterized protein n=2 Tax=Emiliania huxleyi TaxID=2903 RepID=A0A0D3K368_EMIH1|nr:hypothetical protein EMIHUDRAFT_233165 [Emiliania huxleyi CCMP1516]EOD30203.1 hypothetical protein EMIHUDRAFT_233165 [Emiliania huxleyi CCMP1516]|eukprot:XP_005782632.1 hypothetical protein EMIHUDRAFT_233165 [Emiliania huxleyi CCMP1516]